MKFKVTAGYFNPGELILYGKYKNKSGRIVRLFLDEKGHPAVEIEPIPKGRKKNKIMGLFKIWHAPTPAEEKQVMSSIALRVAARFQEKTASANRVASMYRLAAMGETVVQGDIRIHQFRDHFRIWDLTNAGKRGKTVRILVVSPTFDFKGDPDQWMERMGKAIKEYRTLDAVKGFFVDVLQDFPGEIRISEETQRGVDVLPGTVKKIELEWSVKSGDATNSFRLKALPNEFILVSTVPYTNKDKTNTFTQDTMYYNKGKKDAQVFYNWALANESSIKKMSLMEFIKLWHELKIAYDSH